MVKRYNVYIQNLQKDYQKDFEIASKKLMFLKKIKPTIIWIVMVTKIMSSLNFRYQ